MTEQEVFQELERCGAVITDSHICLTPKAEGWFHSNTYLAKDAVTMRVLTAYRLYQDMALSWLGKGVEVVVGPAEGAISIAHGVALCIAHIENRELLAVFTEPSNPADKGSPLELRRGYDRVVANHTVLVVEDILTSGGSALRTIEAVRNAKGQVIGLSVIANRGGVTPAQVGNVEIASLVDVAMSSWPEAECPLCQSFVPLRTDFGKGKDWLATEQGQNWLSSGGSTIP